MRSIGSPRSWAMVRFFNASVASRTEILRAKELRQCRVSSCKAWGDVGVQSIVFHRQPTILRHLLTMLELVEIQLCKQYCILDGSRITYCVCFGAESVVFPRTCKMKPQTAERTVIVGRSKTNLSNKTFCLSIDSNCSMTAWVISVR